MRWQEREANLLALIEGYRERECQRLIDRATEKAKALIQNTYRSERNNLHQRVLAERQRVSSDIESAEAQRDTCRRQRQEASSCELLKRAWPLLEARLMEYWRQPQSRWHWIERYLGEARSVLPHGGWRICAPAWREDDRQRVQALLEPLLGGAVELVTDPRLQAGIVIQAQNAQLDASVAGLLADRAALEARLLSLFREQMPG